MKTNQNGFSMLIAVLIAAAVSLAGVGFFVYQTQIAKPKPAPVVEQTEIQPNQLTEPEVEAKPDITKLEKSAETGIMVKKEILTEKEIAWRENLKKITEGYGSVNWHIHQSEKFGYKIKLPNDWSGTEYVFYNTNAQEYTGKRYSYGINIRERYIENPDLFFQEKNEVAKSENFNIENFEKKEINGLPAITIDVKLNNGRGLYYYFKLPATINSSSEKYRYNAFVIDFSSFYGSLGSGSQERDLISLIAYSFEVVKKIETQRDKQLAKLSNAEYNCPWSGFSAGKAVQFKDGEYGETFSEGEGSYPWSSWCTMSRDYFIYGDFDGNGTEEAAVIVSENSGGTGIFTSLQIISDVNGKLQSTAFLGIDDRPRINSIATNDGKIIIDLIVHAGGDPGCCPNQKEIWSVTLKDGKLIKTILESSRFEEDFAG